MRRRAQRLGVGDAGQLQDLAGGAVPALVAQHRHDVLVAQDREPEQVAGDPALLGGGLTARQDPGAATPSSMSSTGTSRSQTDVIPPSGMEARYSRSPADL